VAVWVDRPASAVYAYAADPRNLPTWAPGLLTSIDQVDGSWVAQSPLGEVVVEFTPPNDLGVMDHDVHLPDGQVVHNPFRVLQGGDHAELVFSVRRLPGMTDEQFATDHGSVRKDLEALKAILEG